MQAKVLGLILQMLPVLKTNLFFLSNHYRIYSYSHLAGCTKTFLHATFMGYILKARSDTMLSLGTSNTSSYSSFVGHGHLLDMTNSIIPDEFNFSLLISEKGGNLSRQESQNP